MTKMYVPSGVENVPTDGLNHSDTGINQVQLDLTFLDAMLLDNKSKYCETLQIHDI